MAMNPIRNEGMAVLRDLGTELNVGANVAVTREGVLIQTLAFSSRIATANSPIIQEDQATVSGQAMMLTGGINNNTLTSQNTTNLDATILATGQYGNVLTTLVFDPSQNGSPIRAEDAAFGDTNSVMMAGITNNKNAAAFSATQGDVLALGANDYGYLFQNIGGSFQNILTGTTTTLKSGAGVLQRIIINKAVAASTYTIYDNTAGSGTKIGTVTQPVSVLESQTVLDYGLRFATGLTIVTSSTDDITVVWD